MHGETRQERFAFAVAWVCAPLLVRVSAARLPGSAAVVAAPVLAQPALVCAPDQPVVLRRFAGAFLCLVVASGLPRAVATLRRLAFAFFALVARLGGNCFWSSR